MSICLSGLNRCSSYVRLSISQSEGGGSRSVLVVTGVTFLICAASGIVAAKAIMISKRRIVRTPDSLRDFESTPGKSFPPPYTRQSPRGHFAVICASAGRHIKHHYCRYRQYPCWRPSSSLARRRWPRWPRRRLSLGLERNADSVRRFPPITVTQTFGGPPVNQRPVEFCRCDICRSERRFSSIASR